MTLIIAFEGLFSYDAIGTQAALAYHKNANKPKPTRPFTGGYVLHGLIVPLIDAKRSDFKFQVFAYTDVDSALGYAKRASYDKLIVLGHSYGGHAALKFVNAFKGQVDLLLTADPRTILYMGSLEKSDNVVKAVNYYQRLTPFLFGYIVKNADVNKKLTASHTGIVLKPELYRTLKENT